MYVEVSGKEKGDNDDSDYDNYDLDRLNGYDSFTGVTEIISVSNEIQQTV